MRTINISIPQTMYQKVEALINRGEYASRSELLRTALRVFFALDKSEEKPTLYQFNKTSIPVVKEELEGAGYNQKFVDSVVAGLKKSSPYQEENKDEN